jgi:hypothetical protein
MKAEEIKLVLKKVSEKNIQLAIMDDIDSAESKIMSSISQMRSAFNSALNLAEDHFSALNTKENLISKAMVSAKELGATDIIKILDSKTKEINQKWSKNQKLIASVKANL